MATPLRLLLVEDTEDDAVLLLRELRRGGYDVACRRVETPEEFSAALAAETWDLVIADYSLPRFSAPAALVLFQQSQIDVPFIVVSGRVGEETAVATMKAGAHDYVMKSSLVRLPAAIARELEEAQFRRERKQAAEALRAAKEAAEAASRAKSTFLANMSHEIRTPLNAVIGMTELVLAGPLSAQQREFLMTVKDSGEALLSVINDILDFSRIEAGKLTLDNSTFDLRESLGDTMKSFAIRAHQRGLELTCLIHPDVPQMVVGDYNRLRQIVVNLVGNAVKFTDQGEVDLEVTRESGFQEPPSPAGRGAGGEGGLQSVAPHHPLRAPTEGWSGEDGDPRDAVLHFTVSDTGIGIPEDKRATIFEMFEQADNSTRRRHGGTGLGLAIAARLVALMDGRIWLESEVGRGSRFHFVVRLGLPEGEPPASVAFEPGCLHGMRVLVVDDNATNRRVLEEVLGNWKMVPTTVPNACAAIEAIKHSHSAGEAYQLVVTDAHMPHVDGFMLAEQIKQDPSISSTVIMMLTSGDRPDDMARCNQLGIAAYLLKPVKQSELLEAIELALGITVPREELLKSASRQSHHAPSLHVLLAEDSLVNQKLAVALLEGRGHTVTVVNNGKEAVAATAAQKFDLLLMDVQMPEMDGLEATAQIRAREQSSGTHLPIIAMTAYALKGDRQRCLGAGMDHYVAKPIRAVELFQAIDTVGEGLGIRDGQKTGSRQAAIPCLESPIPNPQSPIPPQDVVDWAKALETAQGNRKLLRSITAAALEEFPQLTAALRRAIANGDRARLQLAAHTLKGSVRYFGANQVWDYAAKLEDLGRKGQFADAGAIFAALEEELSRLTSVLSDGLRGN